MNRLPVTRKTWFEVVNAAFGRRWDRSTENTIYGYVSGYKTQAYFDAERQIMAMGGWVVSVEYDTIGGNTFMIIREPKNLELAI